MRIIAAAAALALALAASPAFAQAIPNTAEQPGQAEPARVKAGTYQLDPAHTQVSWTVNHLGFSLLQGMFGASEGSITIDPARVSDAKVEVVFRIDEVSVTDTGFATHLRSSDFFDTGRYPTARFVSTSVTPGGGNAATIVGNLTIKDRTVPVTMEAVFVGAGVNPMDNKLNFGFRGTATIKRSDFGVGAIAPAVSDEVRLVINAAFAAR